MLKEVVELSLGTAEDKDDVFIENLNTALFLLLGVLGVFASVVLLGYSVVEAFAGQQLGMSLMHKPVFAVFLLVLGWCSLLLFRKRRRQRKEKTSSLFHRAR
jgi:membrane protein DedA with SNARE-associated domain